MKCSNPCGQSWSPSTFHCVICCRLFWAVQPCPVSFICWAATRSPSVKRPAGPSPTSQLATATRYRSDHFGHRWLEYHVFWWRPQTWVLLLLVGRNAILSPASKKKEVIFHQRPPQQMRCYYQLHKKCRFYYQPYRKEQIFASPTVITHPFHAVFHPEVNVCSLQ